MAAALSADLDRPLYLQLVDRLRCEIEGKRAGERVDSEPALAERFRVSRFTVARAIEILVDEGLIRRRQGLGSFIAPPPLRRQPSYLASFTEAVESQGRVATHRLLAFGETAWQEDLPYERRRNPINRRRTRMFGKHAWAMLSALVLGLGAIATAAAAEKPVALIIAQGGLGDQSYNDLAYAGFKRAIAEMKLVGKPVESKDVVAQAADILRRASDAGFGLVIDLEYSHGDALQTVAKDYADTDYVILNQVKSGANVASVLFQEQEGSYLAGALATLVAKDSSIKGMSGKPVIGVIGGTKSVGIDKFIVGYIQGARAVDPAADVKVAYSNNFGDPSIGLQMAKAMFDAGANVVYQVAGGAGLGVIQAAKETGKFAIGVDTDQDGIAPGAVLTSMIKRTDVAVETVIKDYADHKFPGGKTVTLGLAQDGVGLSPMKFTKDKIPAAMLAKVDDMKAKILSGEIKVWNVVDQGYPDYFK